MAQAPPAQTARANAIVLGAHVLTPGATTTRVDLFIAGPVNVAGIQAKLFYDGNVAEVVDPGTGGEGDNTVVKGASVVVNYDAGTAGAPAGIANAKSIFVAVAASRGANASGTLLTLEFRPKAGAAAGASTPLILSTDKADFVVSDANANPITTASAIGGSLTVGGAANSWSFTAPAGILGSASTDGTNTYVVDNNGVLHARDNKTGAATAGFTLPPTVPANPAFTAGRVEGRPVIRDGKIVVASLDGNIRIFTQASGGAPTATVAAGQPIRATPAVYNNRIYFPTADGKISFVAADGSGTVTASGATNVSSTSSPSASGPTGATTVWVGTQTGVQQFNADLTPLKAVAGGAVPGSPTLGTAVGWAGTETGTVLTFNTATGDALPLNHNAGDPIRNAPYALTPAGPAFVVTTTGVIHAVSATGAGTNTNVKFDAGADVLQSPIVLPSATGGTLWVGDIAGRLHSATVTATTASAQPNIFVSQLPTTSPVATSASSVGIASQDGSVISVSRQ